MTAKADLDTLTIVNTQLELLDPYSFHSRVAELKRGSLPRTSLPGGSRSSTTPMPALDDHDQWLIRCEHTYSEGIEQAARALRKALAAQNAVRMVMGYNVTSPTLKPGESLQDAQRRVMRQARDKAQTVLSDDEQGEYRFTCRWCEQQFKRTRNQRPKNGLCAVCWRLWVAHDRPLHPPQEVIDRRLARASDKAIKEATA